MDEFINSNREIRWGDYYFRNHVIPDNFDYRVHKKELSEYFRKLGFSVSMMYDDYFSRFNGIHSDRYMSMDFYYFYVLPCLNKYEFMLAYTDKNAYSSIFAGFAQPETVVKNVNGHYYVGDDVVSVDVNVAVQSCLRTGDDCIIKPTVETCNGDGVALLDASSRQAVEAQFLKYGVNFIVQRKVRQHEEMARLNDSSLNTLRISTYRGHDGVVHYLEGKTFLRFGGKGTVKDNISSGGWAASVDEHGCISQRLYRFKSMHMGAINEDLNMQQFIVPSFARATKLACQLHERLPYFDLAGWDIAINADGSPLFIEFNAQPDIEIPQALSGPFFGPFFDEVISRVRLVTVAKEVYSIRRWPNGFDHKLRIS